MLHPKHNRSGCWTINATSGCCDASWFILSSLAGGLHIGGFTSEARLWTFCEFVKYWLIFVWRCFNGKFFKMIFEFGKTLAQVQRPSSNSSGAILSQMAEYIWGRLTFNDSTMRCLLSQSTFLSCRHAHATVAVSGILYEDG